MRSMIAMILLSAVASCNRPPAAEYSPQVEANFMRGCASRSAPQSYCACVWEKIEAEIPEQQFAALERMPAAQRDASPITRQIQAFATECQSTASRIIDAREQPPAP